MQLRLFYQTTMPRTQQQKQWNQTVPLVSHSQVQRMLLLLPPLALPPVSPQRGIPAQTFAPSFFWHPTLGHSGLV